MSICTLLNSADELLSLCDEAERQQVYALVDPLAGEVPGQVPDRGCGWLKNPFFSRPQQEQLRLQSLPEGRDEARHGLNAQMSLRAKSLQVGHPLCGWIVSQQNPQAVAYYFSRQLKQINEVGDSVLLRFYDPRVMIRLLDILDHRQLSYLLGPIEYWCFQDYSGVLHLINPHQVQRAPGPIRLTTEQWKAIRRIELVNHCLQGWCEAGQPYDLRLHTKVDHLIAAAQEFEITDSSQVSAFVMDGLLVGSQFYRHPIMHALLKQISKSQSYIQLTRQLDESAWQLIAKGQE